MRCVGSCRSWWCCLGGTSGERGSCFGTTRSGVCCPPQHMRSRLCLLLWWAALRRWWHPHAGTATTSSHWPVICVVLHRAGERPRRLSWQFHWTAFLGASRCIMALPVQLVAVLLLAVLFTVVFSFFVGNQPLWFLSHLHAGIYDMAVCLAAMSRRTAK